MHTTQCCAGELETRWLERRRPVFYEANCEPEQAAPSTTYIAGVRLKTAPESDGGVTYGRWMYEQNGWGDIDDDGCDTREEVLVAEASTLESDDESCVPDGTWWSWYDERTIHERVRRGHRPYGAARRSA